MNRAQRRHGGSGCHKHKGPEGRRFALVWTCPDCFATWFPDQAKDPNRTLTAQEVETGMRVVLGCLKCARAMGEQDGWEFIDFNTHDHNRYMVFCPHEEDLCGGCGDMEDIPEEWPKPGSTDPTQDEHGNCEAEISSTDDVVMWYCTRESGHPMPHVAGTGAEVAAVWDDGERFYDDV